MTKQVIVAADVLRARAEKITKRISIGLAFTMMEDRFPWPKYYVRLVRTDTGNWRCDIELCGGDGPVVSAYDADMVVAMCQAALAVPEGA